ncbi:MAG: TonB-dependent receptor [Candidatus Competibacteraceae bacterium]
MLFVKHGLTHPLLRYHQGFCDQTRQNTMMQDKPNSSSIWILAIVGVLTTASGRIYASGLQITEQSVTGLGRAFAGGSLPNDDASAVYYNPADMMLNKGIQAQFGVTFIGIKMGVSNTGSKTRLPYNLTNVLSKPDTLPVFVTIPGQDGAEDGGTNSFAPNGFFVMDINDRVRFGLGITTPFAVSTDYGNNWVGRYHAIESKLATVDINPSIAYRVNENFSIGAGLSAQYVDATLSQALFNPFSPFVKDGFAEVKADNWSYGYNLGLTYEFDPNTRIGLSYRSRVKQSADGDRTITDYIPTQNGTVSAKAEVTLPDWAALGAYKRLDEQWAVMGSVRWTNWSLFKKLQIDFADGSQALTQENWQDSWSFNLGVSYDYNPDWTFRAGYAHDQHYTFSRVSHPAHSRQRPECGSSVLAASNSQLSVNYMYIIRQVQHG